jgi:hypothetical protein
MADKTIPVYWGTDEGKTQIGEATIDGEYINMRVKDGDLMGWISFGGVSNISIGDTSEMNELDGLREFVAK